MLRTIVILIAIGFLISFIVIGIYSQIRDHYSQQDPLIQELKDDLIKIHPKAKTIKMYTSSNGSYTINKRKIYLCTKDKKSGQTYNKDILRYICYHELAHILNEHEIGHTPNFYLIFDDILKKAQEIGIYDPNVEIPEDYCKA